MLVTRGIGKARRLYYAMVNRMIMHRKTRWTTTLLVVMAYIQTVQAVSYDIATYLIGFYLLQLLISYFTPKGVTDDFDDCDQQQSLYSFADEIQACQIHVAAQGENSLNLQHSTDKPLIRSLGEVQIWERVTFAFVMGLVCSYFKMLDIDVFWPMLLIYFVILVCFTIQKILKTMRKYKYGLADFQKQPI